MKAQIKNITIGVVLISICLAFLNGCNTVQGMGKDLQTGGQAITKAASGSGSSQNKTTNSQLSHQEKMQLEKKMNSSSTPKSKKSTSTTTTQNQTTSTTSTQTMAPANQMNQTTPSTNY